jgi:hypothetical protein
MNPKLRELRLAILITSGFWRVVKIFGPSSDVRTNIDGCMLCSALSNLIVAESTFDHCSQLIFSSPVSVSNHAATVSAYLTDHRNEPDPLNRAKLSFRFSTYLLSLCWPKMHSRIMSWPFIGFIYNIWQLGRGPKVLQDARDQYNWLEHEPGPGDRTLAMHLALPNVDCVLEEIALAGGSSTNLLDTLRTVPADSPQKFTITFYTKETFMDFHHLLLGCLILYAKTLRTLKRLYSRMRAETVIKSKTKLACDPKEGTREHKIIACFDALKNYNQLLVLLMSSHSFVTHLRIMASTTFLLPSVGSRVFHDMYVSILLDHDSEKVDRDEPTEDDHNPPTEENHDEFKVGKA